MEKCNVHQQFINVRQLFMKILFENFRYHKFKNYRLRHRLRISYVTIFTEYLNALSVHAYHTMFNKIRVRDSRIRVSDNVDIIAKWVIVSFFNYTATHNQVTRSRYPHPLSQRLTVSYVNTRKLKMKSPGTPS